MNPNLPEDLVASLKSFERTPNVACLLLVEHPLRTPLFRPRFSTPEVEYKDFEISPGSPSSLLSWLDSRLISYARPPTLLMTLVSPIVITLIAFFLSSLSVILAT